MARSRLPLVQAAIAVVERNGRYLVTQRRPTDHLGGCWEFPGGKRRVGESWRVCLRRELLEELGIIARIGKRLTPLRFRYPDRHVRLEVFRCAIVAGDPKPLVAKEIRWVLPTQLKRLHFPPADEPLLERLSRRVQLRGHRRRDIIRLRRRERG